MNIMAKMMFASHLSRFDFTETVAKVKAAAKENGYTVPQVFDLKGHYNDEGKPEMDRATIVYYCTPESGVSMTRDDANKPMLVMMPTGVAVYETSTGEVRIAHMNFGLMRHMFGGVVKKALAKSAGNMAKAMAGIVAT